MTFSVILASTGMIQLKKVKFITLQMIFIFIGCLVCLCGVLAAFGIKEMQGRNNQGNRRRRATIKENLNSLY